MKTAEEAIQDIVSLLPQNRSRYRGRLKKNYSDDVKKTVIQAVEAGSTPKQIANATGISPASIRKWSSSVDEAISSSVSVQKIEVEPVKDFCLVRLPSGMQIEFNGPMVAEVLQAAIIKSLR